MENYNELMGETQEQTAPKIERVSLDDIQQEQNEQFSEKVDDAFLKVIEAYQKLSPEEKEAVKKYLKNR